MGFVAPPADDEAFTEVNDAENSEGYGIESEDGDSDFYISENTQEYDDEFLTDSEEDYLSDSDEDFE